MAVSNGGLLHPMPEGSLAFFYAGSIFGSTFVELIETQTLFTFQMALKPEMPPITQRHSSGPCRRGPQSLEIV